MKFTCTVCDLLAGISDAAKVMAVKTPLPYMGLMKLEAKRDGITLTGTDGVFTICADVKAEVSETGEYLLPGKLLSDIVRKLPDGLVKLHSDTKTSTAVLQCLKSRFTLSCAPADAFMRVPQINDAHELRVPQRQFKNMIGRTVFAVAQQDESRPALTGCLLEVTKEELRLVGVDGFRLAMLRMRGAFSLPAGQEMMSAIIPRHVIAEMGRMIPDDSKAELALHVSKGYMMAKIGSTTLITSLIAAAFIDYRRIFPQQRFTHITVKSRELERAIERALLIAQHGKNYLIRMAVQDEMMRISSVSDLGDTQEEVDIHLDGDAAELAFNARYIGEAMKYIEEECCVLETQGGTSPCLISSGDADSEYVYMVLPVAQPKR